MHEMINEARLYGIVDLGYVAEEDLESVTEELIRGGADILQLRAKGYEEDVVEKFSKRVFPICQREGVTFIVNDFPEVAARIGADGVHVGQDDGSLSWVRGIVGDTMIVGRSTHSVQQAEAAHEEGFDYIGFGPLFATPTKKGRPGIGLDDVYYVEEKLGTRFPVFFIGGVKQDTIEVVLKSGARRVVIVSELLLSESIERATREAKTIIEQTI